jgi:hypothetical protein
VGESACIVRFVFSTGVWVGLDDTTGIKDGASPTLGEFHFFMSAFVGGTDFLRMLGIMLLERIIVGAGTDTMGASVTVSLTVDEKG